jgi:hypothetical protein
VQVSIRRRYSYYIPEEGIGIQKKKERTNDYGHDDRMQ